MKIPLLLPGRSFDLPGNWSSARLAAVELLLGGHRTLPVNWIFKVNMHRKILPLTNINQNVNAFIWTSLWHNLMFITHQLEHVRSWVTALLYSKRGPLMKIIWSLPPLKWKFTVIMLDIFLGNNLYGKDQLMAVVRVSTHLKTYVEPWEFWKG